MATVTMIVLPAATVAVCVRLFAGLLPVSGVPIVAALTAPTTVRTRAPEGDDTFPAASVAVAMMLCSPALPRGVVVIPSANCAAVPVPICVAPS